MSSNPGLVFLSKKVMGAGKSLAIRNEGGNVEYFL